MTSIAMRMPKAKMSPQLRRDIARHEGLDEGEEEGAEEGARQAAQAPEDGGYEGFEGDAAHLREDLVLHAVEDAGHAGQCPADREDEDYDEACIDAHEGACFHVIGRGLDGLAHFSVVDKDDEGGETDHRDDEHRDVDTTHIEVADLDRSALEKARKEGGRESLGRGADRGYHRVIDKDRGAHRGDDEIQEGGLAIAQGLVGETFQDDGEEGRAAGRQEEGEEKGQAEEGEGEEAEVGAEHDDAAMGEIREVHDRIDEGVADGHEGVDRANGKAVDELLEELVHRTQSLTTGPLTRREAPRLRAGRQKKARHGAIAEAGHHLGNQSTAAYCSLSFISGPTIWMSQAVFPTGS